MNKEEFVNAHDKINEIRKFVGLPIEQDNVSEQVFKSTQKVIMQIVDEHDKWFFTQLQIDMKEHPDKYDNAQLELFERDRIKEVLTLGLNAENQLAELKAENERLNKECYCDFGRVCQSYKSLFKNSMDESKKQFAELKTLKQQLKEKDEELKILKTQIKIQQLSEDTKIKEIRTIKDNYIHTLEEHTHNLKNQLKSNTKRVCEKIRESLRNVENDGECKMSIGINTLIDFDVICDILDQIKKGEKDGN